MIASGNPQSLVLCILDVSVVCAPNRCSIVDDRSPNNVSFCCPPDVPVKALRILFLLDTLCYVVDVLVE